MQEMNGQDAYKWAREYRAPDSSIFTFPLIVMIIVIIILIFIITVVIHKGCEVEAPSVIYVRPVPFI